jgi:hypothetical protein
MDNGKQHHKGRELFTKDLLVRGSAAAAGNGIRGGGNEGEIGEMDEMIETMLVNAEIDTD